MRDSRYLSFWSYRVKHQLLFLRFYLFIFIEIGREEENHRCMRDTSTGCLSHAPNQGPGPQSRHAPWPGIQPVTLWFIGWHSITELHQPGLHQLLFFLTSSFPDFLIRIYGKPCNLFLMPKGSHSSSSWAWVPVIPPGPSLLRDPHFLNNDNVYGVFTTVIGLSKISTRNCLNTGRWLWSLLFNRQRKGSTNVKWLAQGHGAGRPCCQD